MVQRLSERVEERPDGSGRSGVVLGSGTAGTGRRRWELVRVLWTALRRVGQLTSKLVRRGRALEGAGADGLGASIAAGGAGGRLGGRSAGR